MASRYKLEHGTQVREEDFGLLFYTRQGPRLYFFASGDLLGCDFFQGRQTLAQWLENRCNTVDLAPAQARSLKRALGDLRDKGVIIEF